MNNKCDLSVIIPVYNAEKIIYKTVHRLKRQTINNYEIILIENGSTDKSWEICEKLASQDHRVVCKKLNTPGTSLARKEGIKIANGEFICFCDQDDRFVDRNSLKNMVSEIRSAGTDIIQFGCYKGIKGIPLKRCEVAKKKRLISIEHSIPLELFGVFVWQDNPIVNTAVWSKLYKSSLLKSVADQIDKRLIYSEDMFLNIKAIMSGRLKSIAISPNCFYIWSLGGISSSSNSSIKLIEEYCSFRPEIISQLSVENPRLVESIYCDTAYSFRACINQRNDIGATNLITLQKAWNSDLFINMREYFLDNSIDDPFLVGLARCRSFEHAVTYIQ